MLCILGGSLTARKENLQCQPNLTVIDSGQIIDSMQKLECLYSLYVYLSLRFESESFCGARAIFLWRIGRFLLQYFFGPR